MLRPPPRSTRPDTLLPNPTLFLSVARPLQGSMALAPEGTRAMRGCRPVGAKPRPVRRFHQQGPCHDGKAPPTMVKHGEKLCLNGNSGSSETRGNLRSEEHTSELQ